MWNGSTKHIQDVRVGDIVAGQDEKGEKVRNIVTHVFTHGPKEHGMKPYDILTINGTLQVTREHPIHTERGWIEAGDLIQGDILTGLSGRVPVTSIESGSELSHVYNLSVFPTRTYFAGGVLVHNKLWP